MPAHLRRFAIHVLIRFNVVHIPVLLNEVIKYLNPKPGENFIDCTVGAGGHSLAILKKNKPGKLLAIDCDNESLELFKSKIRNSEFSFLHRLTLANDNFRNLKEIVEKYKFHPVNGILLDLGLSSWHIEESKKGFTFRKDEPLGMNFDNRSPSAAEIINNFSEKSLEEIFSKYGEERYSRRIARRIIEKRKNKPIETTFQLRNIVGEVIPFSKTRRGNIDRVLARIFQSLRIAVNDELENLKQGLKQSLEILEPGGRLIIISFHSLEDRIVKNFFRDEKIKNSLKILTKKPIIADEEEVKNNPRSRSAKLRAAVKV